MDNKVVLITGAKGGLGTFVTQTFLSASAQVAGVSRSIKQSDFPSEQFVAVPADILDPAGAQQAVAETLKRFGRIDALVHVTGGFAASPIHSIDDAAWANMRDLNLTSGFNILRAVLPGMRQQGFGRIVVVGSLAAVQPAANLGAYIAFKSALTVLVQTVALENRDRNITANVVLPGTMDTPANRAAMPNADPHSWVQPQHVADAIFSLVNDPSGQITGTLVPIYARNA